MCVCVCVCVCVKQWERDTAAGAVRSIDKGRTTSDWFEDNLFMI